MPRTPRNRRATQVCTPDNVNQRVNALLHLVDADLQTENQKKRHKLLNGIAMYLTIRDMYSENRLDDEFWSVFETFYMMIPYERPVNMDHFKALIRSRTVVPIQDALVDTINTDLPFHERKANLSFVSKALHTIDNDYPIFDRKVKDFFNLPWHSGRDVFERIEKAVERYDRLRQFYHNRNRNGLDRLLEEYTRLLGAHMTPDDLQFHDRQFTRNDAMRISDVKKIDFMIWKYWTA